MYDENDISMVYIPQKLSICCLFYKNYAVQNLKYLSLTFILSIRGSLNKFPDFFRMGTFIDSTHMKL